MARPARYDSTALFDPALDLVTRHGLDGLSLRSLAQALGISVSSITNLVGPKAGLIQCLVDEAMVRQAAIDAPIIALAEQGAPLSAEGLAEIADLALEARQAAAPALQLFGCEMLQASAAQPDLAASLEPWLAAQRGFWARLAAATATPHAALIGEALFALSIDEQAHGCALGSVPAYRRLRRLCLARLCRLDFGGNAGDADRARFAYLTGQLGAMDDTIAIDRDHADVREARTDGLAAAAARILVYEGAGALTHRAVAARARVPSSTLAYHFRTREDLVKAAMQDIIFKLKRSIFAPDPDETPENPGYAIARSTFAVALEAARAPQFVGSAADMRRKRGVNLVYHLNADLAADRQVDAPGAQVLSVISIGAMLAGAHEGIERTSAASGDLMARLLAAGRRGSGGGNRTVITPG